MDSKHWHDRFVVQSQWTKTLREYLNQQTGLHAKCAVLEIGCGTGAILSDLQKFLEIPIFGIDHNLSHLVFAANRLGNPNVSCANAFDLPFDSNSFDYVVCHYFLLWINDPVKALKESYRVLSRGGTFLAYAEPDHLARIDAPELFWQIGAAQTESLIKQGANPMAGRLLPNLMNQAGFKEIQFGVSGFQQSSTLIPDWLDSEWNTLEEDLNGIMDPSFLRQFRAKDIEARQNGSRVMWVPTFYAYGKK